jgi:hypothetical protein
MTLKRMLKIGAGIAVLVALLIVALKTDKVSNDGEWIELWWPLLLVPLVIGVIAWYFIADPHNVRGGGSPRDKGGKP